MSQSSQPLPGFSRKRAPVLSQEWQVQILKSLFDHTSRPTAQQKSKASTDTGLSETWIANWFARQRRHSRPPLSTSTTQHSRKRHISTDEYGFPVARNIDHSTFALSSSIQVKNPITHSGDLPSALSGTSLPVHVSSSTSSQIFWSLDMFSRQTPAFEQNDLPPTMHVFSSRNQVQTTLGVPASSGLSTNHKQHDLGLEQSCVSGSMLLDGHSRTSMSDELHFLDATNGTTPHFDDSQIAEPFERFGSCSPSVDDSSNLEISDTVSQSPNKLSDMGVTFNLLTHTADFFAPSFPTHVFSEFTSSNLNSPAMTWNALPRKAEALPTSHVISAQKALITETDSSKYRSYTLPFNPKSGQEAFPAGGVQQPHSNSTQAYSPLLQQPSASEQVPLSAHTVDETSLLPIHAASTLSILPTSAQHRSLGRPLFYRARKIDLRILIENLAPIDVCKTLHQAATSAQEEVSGDGCHLPVNLARGTASVDKTSLRVTEIDSGTLRAEIDQLVPRGDEGKENIAAVRSPILAEQASARVNKESIIHTVRNCPSILRTTAKQMPLETVSSLLFHTCQ